MQHELLGAAGKDYCLDQATDFQVDSNYGSSQAQRKSFLDWLKLNRLKYLIDRTHKRIYWRK